MNIKESLSEAGINATPFKDKAYKVAEATKIPQEVLQLLHSYAFKTHELGADQWNLFRFGVRPLIKLKICP